MTFFPINLRPAIFTLVFSATFPTAGVSEYLVNKATFDELKKEKFSENTQPIGQAFPDATFVLMSDTAEKKAFDLSNLFRGREVEPKPPYFTPILGGPVFFYTTIENGEVVSKAYSELDDQGRRDLISTPYSNLVVDDKSSDLSFTVPIGSVSLRGGKYRLQYYNIRAKVEPCAPDDLLTGQVLVGVGAQVIVDARIKAFNFTASLSDMANLANGTFKRIKGSVFATVPGLKGDAVLKSKADDASGEATYENLKDASEFMNAASIAFESMNISQPILIGFVDNETPGACRAKFVEAQD